MWTLNAKTLFKIETDKKIASPNPTNDTPLNFSKNYLRSWECYPEALGNDQHGCYVYTEPYVTW